MQYTLISAAIVAAAAFVSASPIPQGGAFASQSIPIAINLNKSFNGLSEFSTCDASIQPNACIEGNLAECSGGKFAITPCSNNLECFALPLVNSVGTSVTCDTPADAAARMGFASVAELNAAIGSGAAAATPAPVAAVTPTAADPPASAATTPPANPPASATVTPPADPPASATTPDDPPAGSIASQSIPLAIALNQSFKNLSASSPCDETKQPNACIGGKFAQCLSTGSFFLSDCAGDLKCFALPLVNSVGTSITCDTAEDAARRMGISEGQL